MALFISDPSATTGVAVVWAGVCSGCMTIDGIAAGAVTKNADSAAQAQMSNMPALRWRGGSLATRAQQKTWIRSFTTPDDQKRPMQVQPVLPVTWKPADSLNNWLDLVSTLLNGGALNLLLSDQDTTWADALFAGYGTLHSDQLIIVDSLGAGYGGLLSDSMNSWLDSLQNVLGLSLSVTDQDTTWLDGLGIGYGNFVVDQLTFADFMGAGYGAATSDQMIIVDSIGAGYGGALSDTMNNWLDLLAFQLAGGAVISLSLTDQDTTWLDALGLGYGNVLADQLQQSDSLGAGYGGGVSDSTANWGDGLGAGYGNLISDQDTTWLDSTAFGLGYLIAATDQFVMLDSLQVGYGLWLTDNLSSWLDLLQFASGGSVLVLVLSDAMSWMDLLGIGYGMVFGDQITWLDSLLISGILFGKSTVFDVETLLSVSVQRIHVQPLGKVQDIESSLAVTVARIKAD